MTFSTVAQANSKTAEFAHLFHLFDRVATRRTRAVAVDTSNLITADDIASVPAQFAPALKNLSMILSSRPLRDERAERVKAASPIQACYGSLASASRTKLGLIPSVSAMELSHEARGGDPEPTFPPVKRYPFTFKLMLYKLYDVDEWTEKVKSVLETSKSQFKPLAERVQNVVRDATTGIKQKGEIKRSSVHPIHSVSTRSKSQSTTEELRSAARPETSRVVKKRCIGRRKSTTGPISAGVWVYDAAISATEVTDPRPSVRNMLFTGRDKDTGRVAGKRAQQRSFTTLKENTVALRLGWQEEEAYEPTSTQRSPTTLARPVPEDVETQSVVKRGGASGFALASEPCKRFTVKRRRCEV